MPLWRDLLVMSPPQEQEILGSSLLQGKLSKKITSLHCYCDDWGKNARMIWPRNFFKQVNKHQMRFFKFLFLSATARVLSYATMCITIGYPITLPFYSGLESNPWSSRFEKFDEFLHVDTIYSNHFCNFSHISKTFFLKNIVLLASFVLKLL
jgi:hypothetical protein